MKSDVAKRIESINNGIIPEGYKKTKVGIVPVEWEEKKIKDYLVLSERPIILEDSKEYELVTVRRGFVGVDSRGKQLGESILVKNYYQLKENDFLISKRQIAHGACGIVPLSLSGAVVSNEYNVFTAKKDLDVFFFNMLMQHPYYKKLFYLMSDGVHIEKLLFKTKDWMKRKLPLPPLPEQQKIAEILGAQDKLIELQERKINQLKTLKKCYLQKMFPKKGCKYPELRFKGFTDAWEQRKLGEVTESIKNGYSYKADGSRDHTYKITRIESISTGVINTDKLGSSDEINESYRLQDGDILFSHINSLQYISNTALYTSNLGEIYHGMNLLNIRAKSNLINSHFLLHLLKIESNRDWFRTVAKPAVNQASISTTEVGAFEFLLPNLKEQQVIADYFDNLDNLITLHQRKLDEEKQKKKALMQLLLTGKVRVI